MNWKCVCGDGDCMSQYFTCFIILLPVWNSDVGHLIAFNVNESFLHVHES
jgi:hypothetical protein